MTFGLPRGRCVIFIVIIRYGDRCLSSPLGQFSAGSMLAVVTVATVVVVPGGSCVFIVVSVAIYDTLVLATGAQVGTDLGPKFALALGLLFVSTNPLRPMSDFANGDAFVVNNNSYIAAFPLLKL